MPGGMTPVRTDNIGEKCRGQIFRLSSIALRPLLNSFGFFLFSKKGTESYGTIVVSWGLPPSIVAESY